jgi:MFS transporter, MHS family, alpha-ketoglutarate permease
VSGVEARAGSVARGAAAANQPLTARRLRSLASGALGNLVEWYDWYAYAAFALYFAPAFFPQGDFTAQLLNSAGVFAIGFLMRPLGAFLMGWFADRHGRKAAFTASILMMSLGSLLIAVTPDHARIGVLAPVILLFARIVQGLSVGGEYGTSATYLSEMAAPGRRGFYSSFQYVTLIMGQLLALALLVLQQALLTDEQLHDWGWRIPFAVGALLSLVVLVLRRTMEESTAYEQLSPQMRRRLLARLFEHPREMLLVLGLTMGGTVAFYTYTTYAQKFLVNTAGFSKDSATLVAAFSLLVFLFVQPLYGLLSDRIGRRPLLLGFGVLGVVFTVPILQALGSAPDSVTAFMLMLCALLIVSGYTSINAVVKAELFPTEVRALGVGFPYAIAVALFGGTAEFVALWLKRIGHESLYYWYVTACIGVSLVVYACMRDTARHSRITD